MSENSALPPIYLRTCRDALAQEQSASLAATNGWEHVDRNQVHADWDEMYRALAHGFGQRDPNDADTQELMHRHYEIACRFYTPSREAYIGMALFYRNNEDMLAFHNSYHEDMVELLVRRSPATPAIVFEWGRQTPRELLPDTHSCDQALPVKVPPAFIRYVTSSRPQP